MEMCASYQANLKQFHMTIVKRTFRYLVGTQELGLWYPKGTHQYLLAYSDSDHAEYKKIRKLLVVNVNSFNDVW